MGEENDSTASDSTKAGDSITETIASIWPERTEEAAGEMLAAALAIKWDNAIRAGCSVKSEMAAARTLIDELGFETAVGRATAVLACLYEYAATEESAGEAEAES